ALDEQLHDQQTCHSRIFDCTVDPCVCHRRKQPREMVRQSKRRRDVCRLGGRCHHESQDVLGRDPFVEICSCVLCHDRAQQVQLRVHKLCLLLRQRASDGAAQQASADLRRHSGFPCHEQVVEPRNHKRCTLRHSRVAI